MNLAGRPSRNGWERKSYDFNTLRIADSGDAAQARRVNPQGVNFFQCQPVRVPRLYFPQRPMRQTSVPDLIPMLDGFPLSAADTDYAIQALIQDDV